MITWIRKRYSGPIVYAANWWGDYDRIAFWDAVDYMGINAFFPLSDRADPSLAELRSRAETIADEFASVQRAANKPVIFTEIGFKSITGTSVRPWDGRATSNPPSMWVSSRGVTRSFSKPSGTGPGSTPCIWWKWYSDLDPDGIHDGDFTPRRKPAEQVLSEWYRKPVVTKKPAAPR